MSESFWDFSVRTYRAEQVAKSCLVLQDDYGVDVNMLLFACWFGVTRGSIEEETLERVFGFSETWADRVVRPLRQVRSWMKTDGCHAQDLPTDACMALREKVKGIELSAEKMQQEVLGSMVVSIPEVVPESAAQLEAIVINIRRYIAMAGIKADADANAALLTIIRAASPTFSVQAIQSRLSDSN